MTTLVKRCIRCREVRGATSFRVVRRQGRVDTCRWCEERDRNEARTVKELRHKVRRLIHEEGVKLSELGRIRDRLARARGRLAAHEGSAPTLTPRDRATA